MPREQRCNRQVHRGTPRRKYEINFVLIDQTFNVTDRLFRIGAIVVFDDFDRYSFAVGAEHEAAGVVYLFHPHFVVGTYRGFRPRRIWPALGECVADAYGFRGHPPHEPRPWGLTLSCQQQQPTLIYVVLTSLLSPRGVLIGCGSSLASCRTETNRTTYHPATSQEIRQCARA